MADTLTFFRAWLSDPLRVASVVPSGERLAALMVRDVDPAKGPVLELGPGTGVFTRALIGRGVRPQDLTLVELGTEFADMLALRYPDAALARLGCRNRPDAACCRSCRAGSERANSVLVSVRRRVHEKERLNDRAIRSADCRTAA